MSKDLFVFDAKVTLRFKVSTKSPASAAESKAFIEFLNEMREMNMLRAWVRYAMLAQFKSEQAGRAAELVVAKDPQAPPAPESKKTPKQGSKEPIEDNSSRPDPEPNQHENLANDFDFTTKPKLTPAEQKAELLEKFAIMD